jgi:hypothetical protein
MDLEAVWRFRVSSNSIHDDIKEDLILAEFDNGQV